MKKYFLFYLLVFFYGQLSAQQPVLELKWLDTAKSNQATGVSWGVPWPKGTVTRDKTFTLTSENGISIPVQSWTLAWWPDGSIKWTGLAAVAPDSLRTFKLAVDNKKETSFSKVSMVTETPVKIRINTGSLQCVISKKGNHIIDSLIAGNRVTGVNGHLECILQNNADGDELASQVKTLYVSQVNKVTVEQKGPVRSVIRIQGNFQSLKTKRTWLPFDVRLYFYAGSNAVRMVHTILYDGMQEKDFIKGLGLVFDVPMSEEMHNRHIRFSGEGPGIWAEPVRPLVGRAPFMLNGRSVFTDQQAGKPIAGINTFDRRTQNNINHLPVWNDYKLVQSNADGFNIQKRTNDKSTWLDVTAGKRSGGLVFVGDTKGGLAVGLKDFWQSYPAALEVRNASKDAAQLKVWLWSPYNDAMDMRHYDTTGHDLDATYEDWQPGFSTPYGIGRTSELTLFASAGVPSNEELSNDASIASHPPVLTASPEYLHSVNVFGVWSLPDRSTPAKKWIEEKLDKAIAFYQKEIDQRNWYGFWNYGDVMHSYDPVRHTWRYDIGGFAWDNTELSTDMWLWYSYLRTGRADIFRMAEAMTRHTSEVDVYHLGKFAGLGSRHNVRHWGDGSKEVRESQAAYRRFYYYLTTDERIGDMMREVAATADVTMSKTDPLRMILPPTKYPTHARIGPDWLALVGNWMTEWERTGDKAWRDRIMAGVNSFSKMPYGFFSGAQGAFGYDPATKQMYQLNDTLGIIHLSILMGGPEIVNELGPLLQDKNLDRMWLQFCRLYGGSQDEIKKEFGKGGNLGSMQGDYARMPAYYAYITKDTAFAARAWNLFLSPRSANIFEWKLVNGSNTVKALQEVPFISTNSTAQWCLNAIQLLEMIGDRLPVKNDLWPDPNQQSK
jgi:hypothetical protein